MYNLASGSQGYTLYSEVKDDKIIQVMIMSPQIKDTIIIIGATGYACPEIAKINDLNTKISAVAVRAAKSGSGE